MKSFGGEIELVVEGDKTRRICARSLIGRNPSFLFSFREPIRIGRSQSLLCSADEGRGEEEKGGRRKRKVKMYLGR
jgi:hypothetical protein